MKILLVRLGALGDIVHGLPVAAALRSAWPGAQLDWLVDARHARFLELVPIVRPVAVDSRRAAPLLAAIRALRRERYDAAVDMQGLIKSATLARLSGATRVIGFGRLHLREPAASFFYSERRDPPAAGHVIEKNLSLLAAFGLDDRARRFPIAVPDSNASSAVQASVAQAGRSGYALLNPGAAWPNKRWPPERFGAAAEHLARRHGLLPVVTWGPGEEGLADAVVATSGGQAVAAPPTSVGDLLALSRGARLMVSGDTGPLHLAAAVGAPIVALFGPTDPERNGPWHEFDVTLSRFGDCVCHYQRRCRRAGACIEEIPVEDVRGAIDRRLSAEHHA